MQHDQKNRPFCRNVRMTGKSRVYDTETKRGDKWNELLEHMNMIPNH